MDMNVYTTLGERLKGLRNETGLTQAELTSNINDIYDTKINNAMWSKWENDKEVPSLDNLRIISDYFRTSLDYLSGLSDSRWEDNSDLPLSIALRKNKESEAYYKAKYHPKSEEDEEMNKELSKILQMAKENPEIRVLFSLAKNLSQEDLKQLTSFIKMLQKDGD